MLRRCWCGDPGSDRYGEVGGVELRRCRACGAIRFGTVAAPETVYRDGYHSGEVPFGWDWTSAQACRYEEAIAHARLAWIERYCAVRGRLADVGGGVGHLTAAARRRGWDAILIEPVPAAVRHATEVLGVPARCGGIGDLDHERFDLVVLSHVLEHLPDPSGALEGVAEVLGPDGHLYVEVPNVASVARHLLGASWSGWQPGQHIWFFSPRSLRRLLGRTGYSVVAIGTFAPLWEGLSPGACAHFLGVEKLLNAAVRARRWGSVTRRRPEDAAVRAAEPVAAARGVRGAAYRRAFAALARAEAALGVAANIRALAKPAYRHKRTSRQ